MTSVDRSTGEILSDPSDIERRIGIVPLAELLPERQRLVEQVADLRARYGSFGTFSDLRRIELAKCAAIIRAQATQDKRKISAKQVDDEAHAHPAYIDFVILATQQRALWCKLEAKIEAIDFTINRGQSISRFASAELHLTP